MTEHTEEFSKFTEPVTCREYTLPRDEKSTDPKGWIRGNTKIGPVLEVTTSCLQGKYGVEIKIKSVNKDNSHSWVRISHGLNKLVTDLIEDGSICVCKPTKGKSKTEKTFHCLLVFKNCTYSWKNMDWYWTRSSIRSSVPSCTKTKYSSSARRLTSRRRWGDRILETERWSSEQIWVLSILVCWCMEGQDGRRRRQQENISTLYWSVRTRNSLPSSSSRSFRTQSHWSYTAG